MPKMRTQDELKAEHKAPITEDVYVPSKLLDGTDCNILCDRHASKSFVSKIFYLNCPLLHSFPQIVSKMTNILVGNGQGEVEVLFVIPIVINLQGHRFEVYVLVCDIHDDVDMVMGIKNVYEVEGVTSTKGIMFTFSEQIHLFLP